MKLSFSGIKDKVEDKSTPKKSGVSISYSQFSTYQKCPKSWELKYVKGLREYDDNISTIFGTAMHETIQDYLEVLYNQTAVAADNMDLQELLTEKMRSEFLNSREKRGKDPATQFEMIEHLEDGIEILKFLKRKRAKYFLRRKYRLVGIELPLDINASSENDHVAMRGFLDVVLEDMEASRLIILDLKTSTRGWNKWAKQDKTKTSQLILYKEYYSRQYKYDIDRIDIKYLILRRKIDVDSMFPAPRIQSFVPASGKPTRNKVLKELDHFIGHSFDNDTGERLDHGKYPAIAGKRFKNCKYCQFKDRDDLCPKNNRITEN